MMCATGPRKSSLAIAAAIIAAALPSVALAQGGPGPRPGTEAAVQCLVRQGPKDCEKMFVGRAWTAARPWVFENPDRDFKRGPLVSDDYWGRASKTNAFDARILIDQPVTEMDLYDVKFAHVEYTFYVAPADADGKIHGLAIRLYPPHDPLQIHSHD